MASSPESVLAATIVRSGDGDWDASTALPEAAGLASTGALAAAVAPGDALGSALTATRAASGMEQARPPTMTSRRRAASKGDILSTSGSTTRFGTKKSANQREMKAQPGARAASRRLARAGERACAVHMPPKSRSIPASGDGKRMAHIANSWRRAKLAPMIPPSEEPVTSVLAPAVRNFDRSALELAYAIPVPRWVKKVTKGGSVNGSVATNFSHTAKCGARVCSSKPSRPRYCSKKWKVLDVASSSPYKYVTARGSVDNVPR